jgi:TPR repeat protein
MLKKTLLLIFALLTVSCAYANNNEGVRALNAGHYKQAFSLFSTASENGSVSAKYNLAYMWQNGLGVRTNYIKAKKLYITASKQGYAKAFANLGYMYTEGQGVKVNQLKAIEYFQQAIKLNIISVPARNIALIYYHHQIKSKHPYVMAIRYFKKSALAGDAFSQYYLGLGYLKGQGVKQSNQEAYDWFSRAKLGGYTKAQQGLSQLYARLTPAQIKKLQKR